MQKHVPVCVSRSKHCRHPAQPRNAWSHVLRVALTARRALAVFVACHLSGTDFDAAYIATEGSVVQKPCWEDRGRVSGVPRASAIGRTSSPSIPHFTSSNLPLPPLPSFSRVKAVTASQAACLATQTRRLVLFREEHLIAPMLLLEFLSQGRASPTGRDSAAVSHFSLDDTCGGIVKLCQ